jgi:cytochrome c
MIRRARHLLPAAATALLAVIATPGPASAQEATQAASERSPAEDRARLMLPYPDAEHGRFLFVSKGCVICHSINGVGGKAGPALDAPETSAPVAPLDFAARMWRGAVAMAVLQTMEFGYQIEITGDEIADLAAFAASRAAQEGFSDADIPEMMQGWTLDEGFPGEGAELPVPPQQ